MTDPDTEAQLEAAVDTAWDATSSLRRLIDRHRDEYEEMVVSWYKAREQFVAARCRLEAYREQERVECVSRTALPKETR